MRCSDDNPRSPGRRRPGFPALLVLAGLPALFLVGGLPALCLVASFVTACAPAATDPAPAAIVVTDDAGRTVRLAQPARRVFSVIPSLTETIAALEPTALVARTRFDRAPEFAHLPSLGASFQPSLEALAELRPDLVISWADPGQRTLSDRMEALGLPTYRADVQTTEGMRSHIRRLGALLGREHRAAALTASIDRGLARVAAAVRGRPPVSLYYAVWHDPPQTTGPGTFLHEMIEIAGGRNIFADAGRPWPQVSLEVILRRDPEALVLARQAADESPVRWLDEAGWRDLEAVRRDRVLIVESDLFHRPGPRLADAARQLARFLHGEGILPVENAGAGSVGGSRPTSSRAQ